MKFIKNLSTKNIFLFLIFYSVLSLGYVLLLEYVFHYKPCKLCLYQRIPYLFIFIFSILGFFFQKNSLWLYVILILFISNIAISGYHSGVEFGFFNESTLCTSELAKSLDKTEILKNLNSTMPSCKNVEFKFLGLSLATINFLISMIISFLIYSKIKYEKNR